MPALLQAALWSALRGLLAFGAGYLVEHGVWTQGNADIYVGAGAMFLVQFLWSVWSHYKSRLKFLTALESPPGHTEAQIDAKIANGTGAELSSPLGK